MENNTITIPNDQVTTNSEDKFQVSKHYASVNELTQLIETFSKKLHTLNSIFGKLQEGNLSNELSSYRRDELLNSLNSEKELLNNLYEGFADSLQKDINKIEKIRINSNVNTNIFQDYLEEDNTDKPLNTSQLFHKLHK